ncbi:MULTISPECIES: rhodanese-like domain-containing protein [Tropicimonas]|uniref:Rhodanese-related sulfurtransferase n=2 Tax=Tropicimonas TaxID=599652 RepID=A0A239M8J7_9RHOB|nr:rhodanese-like domain-containing protein [Tropicimonas sediminicola]SNT38981.1 Rhodanese-related sulfurtransferase [Tropicimonas sediminicola]
MKSANDYLEEAHAVVPKITPEEGISRHAEGKSVFLDVRDSSDIAHSGTIAGAVRVPRGMIEFAADPNTPFHETRLHYDADIVLVCGAGGQAALTGKTLLDMGYKHVSNVGGFNAWKEAGGPTEG